MSLLSANIRPDWVLVTIFAGDSFPASASWHVTPSVTFCDVSVTRGRPRVRAGNAPSLSEVSDLIMSPLLCCDRLYFLSFCLDTNYGNKHSPALGAHKALCHVTRVSPQQFSCLNQSELMAECWRKSAIKLSYEELSSAPPGHRAWSWHPMGPGGEGGASNTAITAWCYALWSHGRGETADQRPPRDSQWSNNSISIVCRPGRAASVGGELGQRGVRDMAQIMQHSAECCSQVTHAAVTSLRTVETRETKFSFFRHFYKINLLFRCIWMKLVTHCLYFAKLSRCCWKLEHNLDEPSLTDLTQKETHQQIFCILDLMLKRVP